MLASLLVSNNLAAFRMSFLICIHPWLSRGNLTLFTFGIGDL